LEFIKKSFFRRWIGSSRAADDRPARLILDYRVMEQPNEAEIVPLAIGC
jgi:hypothetical protein